MSACKIQAFKNVEDCTGEISCPVLFFTKEAKTARQGYRLTERSTITVRKLKDVCRTRWVERIDAYATFMELLSAVVLAFQEISRHPRIAGHQSYRNNHSVTSPEDNNPV